MFLPKFNADAEKAALKDNCDRIEAWSMDIIPSDLRNEVVVSVQEAVCGDPECSPVDTVVTLLFNSGANGMFGLPMNASEVTLEELCENFPTEEYLRKWAAGEEAEWPPEPEFDDSLMPQLRFAVGAKVLCRVGPEDWFPGTIIQKWYREDTWPKGAWAPYKVELDDGRKIFAPADLPQIIKERTA